ncbi:hypothetical protein BDQ17DRAFT_1390827 [Cyathus striatus]|nr:hypothetical protein BDQ17DRAFT_1390827 [Cyathus striatus]
MRTSSSATDDQDSSARPLPELIQPTPSTTSHSFDPQSPLASSSIPAKRSPPHSGAEDIPDQTMAKRLRAQSPDPRRPPTNRSIRSQSSPAAPAKKKRTRTLTTPHQSAVLHALLAQSRFPTTAMREEVGRAIGLSARKVQVINDRKQTSTHPGDTGSHRPPQYGAFLSTATTGTMGSFSVIPEPMGEAGPSQSPSYSTGPSFYARPGENYSGYSSAEAYNSPVESPNRLLGPGMPGGESSTAPQYRTYGREAQAPMVIGAYPPPGPPFGGNTAAHQLHHRPATSQPRLIHERDASRTLPPLPPTRPVTSSSLGSHRFSAPIFTGPTSAAQFPALRSASPEPRFAHHPPGSPVVLPPPFTLQPQPQWDDDTFPSLPRPGSSAWSRSGSHSTGGRPSPPASFGRSLGTSVERTTNYTTENVQLPAEDVQPSRHGRYDPVRAVFVPTPSRKPAEHEDTETGSS